MIQISGRDSQASWKDLPSTSLFPLPGLLLIVMGSVIGALTFLGFQSSEILLRWFFQRLPPRGIGDWSLPVLLLYYSWTGLVGVFGFLLSLPVVSGTGRRLSALIDVSAWQLWEIYRGPIQETLRRDEEPRAYTRVDDPRLEAPILLERLYLVLLAFGHALALTSVHHSLQVDPYLAGQLWARYGMVSGIANLLAAGWCGTSFGFAASLLALSVFSHIFVASLDPALTGPAQGLPTGVLTLATLGLTVMGLYRNAQRERAQDLLLVTDRGLRRCHLLDGVVTTWQKADAPLLLVATPVSAGVRLQVGSKDGRDKLRPFRISGDQAGAGVRAELHAHALDAELQGSDESSGIAGHLGEIPLLGWILVLALVGATHWALLPPQLARLEMDSLFLVHREEWAQGNPEPLEGALSELLERSPDLGPALATRARVLVDLGDLQGARTMLARLASNRGAWPEGKLMRQAREILREIEEEAALLRSRAGGAGTGSGEDPDSEDPDSEDPDSEAPDRASGTGTEEAGPSEAAPR